MSRLDDNFMKLQRALHVARNHESNVIYWNIILVALQDEEPLFAETPEEYKKKERQIRRKIHKNERRAQRYFHKADRLIKKYHFIARGEQG